MLLEMHSEHEHLKATYEALQKEMALVTQRYQGLQRECEAQGSTA